MADDESITLSAKQFKVIVIGIVSAVVFLGGVGGSGIIRFDKFGLTDYERLEKEHAKSEDNKRTALELKIRRGMPPPATRARIRAIERHLERTSDFEAATLGWN